MSDSIEHQIERLLRADFAQRDAGLAETLHHCESAGEAVFLFGCDSATIHALRARVRSAFPRLRVAGICDADFSGPAGRAILNHIAACAPDVVIADVAPKRHRALIAEFAAHGLHIGLLNRPGTFARYAAARSGAGAAGLAARLPLPLGRALGGVATALRFSGTVARQLVHDGAPRLASHAFHTVRRDG